MSEPMLCACCGHVMNHHADKIIYPDVGAHIHEFHQCPNCGAAANRKAEEQDDV